MVSREINHLVTNNLFTTITNTNFDPRDIVDRIVETVDAKAALLPQLGEEGGLPEAAHWTVDDGVKHNTKGLGVLATEDEDITSISPIRIRRARYGLNWLVSIFSCLRMSLIFPVFVIAILYATCLSFSDNSDQIFSYA